MINILVVEDDEKLNRLVCTHLTERGFRTIGCLRAVEAFDRMIDTLIDLIISDIMMPEIDGFKFAAMVREQDKTIPMLFMTSRDDIASKEQGFRIGIDDYMVKPVDLNELTLRIGALLRRANIANEKKLTAGSLVLNADEMTATLAGEEIPLTVREFNVLFKLLSYPKKTFTRNQLMDDFWGTESESTPRTVDVYITKLREKFFACKDFEIVTVHGLGYKAVPK
ncbi:response regulator transcription factor [Treponema primitia]|uniref:response regulator transcription factor n=1 Tax=Treponema primitia TaxID=88058 RepID=UPI00397FC3EC